MNSNNPNNSNNSNNSKYKTKNQESQQELEQGNVKVKFKKNEQIVNIEKFIISLGKIGLDESLLSILDNDTYMAFRDANMKEYKNDYKAFINKVNNMNLKYISDLSKILHKVNPVIFKLNIYMPNLVELTFPQLIVWIYKVEIDPKKLKEDEKKQFFHLIYKYQQANRLDTMLELLVRIQYYIKHAFKYKKKI